MTSSCFGLKAPTASYWDLTDRLRAVLCEAAVAELLYREDPGTVLHRPNHRLTDVEGRGIHADAKTAWRQGQGDIGFMGAGRQQEVRPGVTHYALVVAEPFVAATMATGCGGLDIHGHLHADVAFSAAASLNAAARPRYPTGRNLVVPASAISYVEHL